MAVGDFVQVHEWLALGNESGAPFLNNTRPDRTVQVTGTFDSATVLIEGSNDNSTWATLTDIDATALSFTSTALKLIRECPAYLRPTVSGGGGSVSINVYVSNT